MRIVLRSAIVLAALGASSATFAAPVDPSGTWLTKDGRAKIRIDRCGPSNANICGKVVWLRPDQPKLDDQNPDPSKRTRQMLGLQLMSNMKPAGDKFSGEIYNSDDGKMYAVTVTRDSQSELSIGGCMMAILCGSETWARVPDVNQQAANTAAPEAKAVAKPAKPAASKAPVGPSDDN